MRASRASTTLVLAVSLALAIGCGGSAGPDRGSVADRRLGLPPPPVTPPPLPVDVHEALTAAPVAPPSIESIELGPVGPIPTPVPLPSTCDVNKVAMQVLVIAADGNEPSLPAIQQALGYHTIPFTTWIATSNPGMLTADKLFTGCNGKYQAVILATGDLVYSPDGGVTWASALTTPEWLTLRSYEQSFKVREISWYVYPGADFGLTPPTAGVDTGAVPIDARLTAAGAKVFPTVNAANPIPITYSWTYLATPADPNVTPLLVDAVGNALVSSRVNSDGRETLAMTFDSNQWLIHDLVLAHGLIEWVTKGMYLGEFRAYTEAQLDDFLIDDDMYLGGSYRMTDADFNATRAWQANQKSIAGPTFRLAWAFNAYGASAESGASPDDPLTKAAKTYSSEFQWISHTWDHTNLDNMSYADAFAEFDKNDKFAKSQGWANYNTVNLVTPEVSGLTNPAAMKAAWDVGIRYTISDTSRAGWDNPAPNIGIYSTLQPGILHIPRKPTNLFYNVSTPAEWMAEYNSLYTSYWGRALTYQEILDKESQNLLVYLLQGNIDPAMYHQPNARAYDGSHTLLGDLLDVTFAKFRKYSTLPIVSPDQHEAGARMARTMARNAAGVTAVLTPGVSVSFTSPTAVDFAVTGLCTATAERYAGKCIATVSVPAGLTVTYLLF